MTPEIIEDRKRNKRALAWAGCRVGHTRHISMVQRAVLPHGSRLREEPSVLDRVQRGGAEPGV